ncbi:uncharacterized protein LOC118487529 [Helianthus annuus]|uniref:uncharacterized protein LOC110914183 n=1 Tax=Helianthus annuus TaxID=4232 RepID=UPI000B9071C7|nr:uncharacterized protein LOC110914183 [Helianthus annuus]XP_035840349.1 uncharacterized protein LOC118487529 [Helianthus annuus]
MTGLKKRGMLSGAATCKLCRDQGEDADHLFTGCYVAAILWHKVSTWCKIQPIFAFTMKDLLEFHKTQLMEEPKRKYVKTIILATCWSIWKARNEGIFNGKRASIDGIFGEMQANFCGLNAEQRKWILIGGAGQILSFYNGE